ncbi:MAG: TatD family hydrolase [Alphaproteobacteria bacterium]|nr:TatD family hydrolase [Alphaproteobacteria bacterium]
MFIDTHCHLTDKYTDGLDSVIQNAHNAGVDVLICPTADPNDISGALKIANTYNNVYCTIGIHPEYSNVNATDFLTDDILSNPRVVGVGEIGLDYHYSPETRQQQIKLFEQQLDIAKKHALPVAIHTRDAEQDTADILHGDVRGVMHCFTSSWDLAKKMLDRGFFFSASGILTFKNSDEIRDTFSKIPIDRIVIETDAPYCTPVPHRGKICEPFMVVDTARVLAQIKNIDINDLEKILMDNVKKLYPKIEF